MIKSLPFLLAFSLTAALATQVNAQEAEAVFDAEAGYTIIGGVVDRVLVENQGVTFACATRPHPDWIELGRCLPIRAAIAADSGEEANRFVAVVESLKTLDPEFTALYLAEYFEQQSCSIDISSKEVTDAAQEDVIAFLAKRFGLDEMSFDLDPFKFQYVHTQLDLAANAAAKYMMDVGSIAISDDGNSIIYEGCD